MALISSFLGKGTKAIGQYFGLLDSLDIKVKKLIKSELDSGLAALKQAQLSDCEQTSLLREARNKFNKAIFLEKEERLVAAYLGLTLCHFQLGDLSNVANTLKEFSETQISFNWQRKMNYSLKTECGYLLDGISDGLLKVSRKDRLKKMSISKNKFWQTSQNYLRKINHNSQKLIDDNSYKMYGICSQIEQLKLEAETLSENFLTGNREVYNLQLENCDLENSTQSLLKTNQIL